MKQPDFSREWKRAPFFHETAEALGVPTINIVAVVETHNQTSVTAFYSEVGRATRTDPILSITLDRDEDGVLRPVGGPTLHPNLWEALGMEESP